MSTQERITPIEDPRIPKGYRVLFHEIRGYDSPDKWYTAWKGHRQLRGRGGVVDFSRLEEAISLCVVVAAVGPRPWWERLE